jgi:hypothetical protein
MDLRAIALVEDEEEKRWRAAGQELRRILSTDQWREAGLAERMHLLTTAHDALRPAFHLTRKTRLAFVADIDGHDAGGGYDDEAGTYVLIVMGELDREDPAPLVAAIAHELRHAYQHEARDGVVRDDRADLWREARTHYDSAGPGYEHGPLETDAERAQVEVGAAYSSS